MNIVEKLNRKGVITMQLRITSLDIIRGLAICAVLFVNMQYMTPVPSDTHNFTNVDKVIELIYSIVIRGKFISVFTILFGIGIGIFIDNAKFKERPPYKLMFRRLIFLFVVGIPCMILGMPFLQYAFVGFFVMFATKIKKPWVILAISFIPLIFSLINLIIHNGNTPSMTLTLFFLMLFGLYLSESKIIYNLKRHYYFLYTTLLIACIPVIICLTLYYTGTISGKLAHGLAEPFQAIGYLMILFLVFQSSFMKKVFTPFEKIGKMAFTNFILQGLLIIITLRIFGYLTPKVGIFVSIIIIVINVLLSHYWLKHFKQGPLEKLWRKWTYKNVTQSKTQSAQHTVKI